MANTAAKKQAVSNVKALKQLHIAAAVINGLFLACHFLFQRPASIKPYLVFSLPAFFLQYQLERIGRPKYDSKGTLVKAGDDLSQKGLTEWFHDVIYVTWVCDVLVAIVGRNWVWYLYLSVSIFDPKNEYWPKV